MNFDHLETPLDEAPLFPVELPDGRKDWPENARQAALFSMMRYAAPQIVGFPIPNAGKRNPAKARKEGIRAGVFDTVWHGPHPLTAYVELKGYDKRGRPGKLSQSQIDWGNRMHRLGFPVACFFSPHNAVNWLREQGFDIKDIRHAA